MTSRRPSDLAERISRHREPDAGLSLETIRLPVEAARATARNILSRSQQGGYVTIVERWRQLPDGLIEFTMRRLPTAD
jgi:hypothetical protein